MTEIQQLSDETRHKRLMHLLDTSSIYVNFLLERIAEEEKAPKKSVTDKIKHPNHPSVKNIKGEDSGNTKVDRGKRVSPRAAKRKKETSNVSDVLDKEDLIKRQRLNEEGDSKKLGRSHDGKEISDRQPQLLTGQLKSL